jgi:hypothetical protein
MPIFYCIVGGKEARREDFLSHKERGIAPRSNDPEVLRTHDGVSVFDRLARARRKAKGMPWRGHAHIAELDVPDDGSFRFERTFLTSKRHWTLWGNPDALLQRVVSILPVEGV